MPLGQFVEVPVNEWVRSLAHRLACEGMTADEALIEVRSALATDPTFAAVAVLTAAGYAGLLVQRLSIALDLPVLEVIQQLAEQEGRADG